MTQTISVEGVETPLMSEKGIERINSLGKITHDDALSGPFLPRASDDENLTASDAFHLTGKHDQHTHGHSAGHHASIPEVEMAGKLNKGKKLDPKSSDHDEAVLAGAIAGWTHQADGKNEHTPNSGEMRSQITGAMHNPTAQTPGGAFVRTVAMAPPNAPELHRGLHNVGPRDIPTEGSVFDMGPTSFTRSTKVRDKFATPEEHGFAGQTIVHYKLKKGSRSLQISQNAGMYKWEEEHVTMGRFKVTSRRDSTKTIKINGEKKDFPFVEIELEQTDFDAPITHSAGRIEAPVDNPWG